MASTTDSAHPPTTDSAHPSTTDSADPPPRTYAVSTSAAAPEEVSAPAASPTSAPSKDKKINFFHGVGDPAQLEFASVIERVTAEFGNVLKDQRFVTRKEREEREFAA